MLYVLLADSRKLIKTRNEIDDDDGNNSSN